MKYFLTLAGMLFFLYSSACECDEQPLILDLYVAEVVFTGTAIDKTYSRDSTEYTITFSASKFYKNTQIDRDTLKFTKAAEGRYSGTWSSCDYHLSAGGEWLVIASYRGDEIWFGHCSASQEIVTQHLSNETKELLDNLNNFVISEHRFRPGGSFTSTKPMMNLDSLAESVGTKEFEKQTQLIVFDFDHQGNLTAANFYPQEEKKMTEPSFGLSWLQNIAYAKPLNDFEELALELARKIAQWKPIKHRSTGEPVLGRALAFISVIENGYIQIAF